MSNTVVYLYDHQGNIRTQLFDITNFECTQNLNSYDTASFQIKNTDSDNTEINLKMYNECKIAVVTDDGEKTYIHGVIDSVEAGLVDTVVFVRSFEWLFEKKIIDVDKNYTGQALDVVVADLLGDINGRYDMGITLSCDVTDTIDLVAKKGTTLASVLKEIVGLGYQYRVTNKVLNVATIVGQDKSSGVNAVELRRVEDDPMDRNISEAKMKREGGDMVNAPFHTSGGFSTDPTSIGDYGRLEQTVSSDGTPAQALSDALEKHKAPMQVIEVVPSVDDFFFADIGDKIKVTLETSSELMQYDGEVNVLKKLIDTRGVVRMEVSSTTVRALSFFETVKANAKEIQKLKTT